MTVFKKIGGQRGDVLFSCCLNSHGEHPNCSSCSTCQEVNTRSGRPCRRKTCRDARYCFTHLRMRYNVAIGVSRIPNGGLGLFCFTHRNIGAGERRRHAQPIFNAGDFIVPYGGHELRQATLNRLYDYTHNRRRVVNTGPYAIESDHKGHVVDAMCFRQAGAYANDHRHSGKPVNAELRTDGVYAVREIYKGDEILVDYGDQYWRGQNGLETQTKTIRADSSVDRVGNMGRYIRANAEVGIP